MTALVRPAGAGTRRLDRVLVVALATLLAAMVTLYAAPTAGATTRTPLVGLFKLTAGSWNNGPHGTYFRMLQPGGKTYLANTSSTAHAKYTFLRPGTDGGLRTGVYQSAPKPAFASNGDARSGRITAPVKFYGIKFSTSTNKVDPQTGHTTAKPVIYRSGSTLSGDLRAFAAAWNRQNFNQGSPKPNGGRPGLTTPVTGTYNARTHGFTLTWRSKIVGGPFSNFTGEWHLAGTFVKASSARTAASSARTTGLASAAGLVGFGAFLGRRRRGVALA